MCPTGLRRRKSLTSFFRSVQLREHVNLMMRNPHAVSIFWGEELTMIYNEAYKEVIGRQPAMGQSFAEAFSATWNMVRVLVPHLPKPI